MDALENAAADLAPTPVLVLGIESGSVALAWLSGASVEILGETDLEGRSYSTTLIAAVGDLLARAGVRLGQLHAMVAVNGPGSFTGVRVGLSAVKGLAEPGQIPVVAVSRLAVLAWKAGADGAALDAHRREVFLRLGAGRELLAGLGELTAIKPIGGPIAVCDDAAAEVLAGVWLDVELLRASAPSAGDALCLCADRVLTRDFVDLALLDGHYLRRSDAEIFGAAPAGAGRA
jgi:tRNA threonylcarbamoyladenosine biosynthesis protein TsaB